MEDLYEKGEEKFGYFTSKMYQIVAKRMGSMQRFYAFIAEDVNRADPKIVLDVGTGPGLLLKRIAKINRKIYAVDPSSYMVSLSKKNNAGAKNLHIRYGSSRKIPFNQKYDLIISTLSLHHWKGKESSMSYLSTLLRRGGEIRVYEFEKSAKRSRFRVSSSHGLSLSEARLVAKKANLRIKGIKKRDGFLRVTFSSIGKNHKNL